MFSIKNVLFTTILMLTYWCSDAQKYSSNHITSPISSSFSKNVSEKYYNLKRGEIKSVDNSSDSILSKDGLSSARSLNIATDSFRIYYEYELADTMRVTLELFNWVDNLMYVVANGIQQDGKYYYVSDKRMLPPGDYKIRLSLNNQPVLIRGLKLD